MAASVDEDSKPVRASANLDAGNHSVYLAPNGCQPGQFLPQPVKPFGVSGEQDPLDSDIPLQLGNSRAIVTVDDDDVYPLFTCLWRFQGLSPRDHLSRECGERDFAGNAKTSQRKKDWTCSLGSNNPDEQLDVTLHQFCSPRVHQVRPRLKLYLPKPVYRRK